MLTHLSFPCTPKEYRDLKLSTLGRRLTEMRQDVAETKDTIKDVLETDQLAGLCLTELQQQGIEPTDLPRSSDSMKEAALLLQSYERQISTLENALKVTSQSNA